MCGHCATNILLSKICLLFFTMFDSAGLYMIDRLSITSGNTTPYFQASSTFPIYISWLWCTPFMYTMICLVVVCSCYHGLAINSLYSILWTYHLPTILTSGAYFFAYLCQIILMHAPYYSTHDLSHQNPVIAHKCLQGRPYIRISSALQR